MAIVFKPSFAVIITLVLCVFPRWACSSLQTGTPRQHSCDVALLLGFLCAFQICGESQCVLDHLWRWFGRSDSNPSSKHLECIYTYLSVTRSQCHLNARSKGGQCMEGFLSSSNGIPWIFVPIWYLLDTKLGRTLESTPVKWFNIPYSNEIHSAALEPPKVTNLQSI